MPLTASSRPCPSVYGVGSAEVVLLKRALWLCLRLRLVVSGDCSRTAGEGQVGGAGGTSVGQGAGPWLWL
ncbi:hypothetical protein ACFPH6_49300 [Streptomyces xiangluensis]|uniref:Uncharacterized protein n=1 Tax=Streptomyces xiangluensis TaxID=2665720 RepID=A0ABV8Z7U8_9ACTN